MHLVFTMHRFGVFVLNYNSTAGLFLFVGSTNGVYTRYMLTGLGLKMSCNQANTQHHASTKPTGHAHMTQV